MNSDFEWILEDCLKRLRSGQSREDCLAAYPEHSERLRPLIQAATHLRTVTASQPRPQAIQAGRERMLATARSNSTGNSFVQPVSSGDFSRYTVRIFTFIKTLLFGKETHGMKFALRLAIDLIVILMIGGILTVNASARSLPGDPLYSVKRTWEEMRLTLTLDDPARQKLQDQFRQMRLEEVREMMQMGKTGLVEFEGQLESLTAEEWVVSGIRVGMQPDTIVEGDPEAGQVVRVRARVLNNGTVIALQVRMLSQPAFYPSPKSSHTPVLTPIPSLTTWPTHTGEPMYKPTYEPTHMPWPSPEPTHHTWPNDDDHNDIPLTTPWPNDDCCDDDNHHNDNDADNSGGWDAGSGSHHSWP